MARRDSASVSFRAALPLGNAGASRRATRLSPAAGGREFSSRSALPGTWLQAAVSAPSPVPVQRAPRRGVIVPPGRVPEPPGSRFAKPARGAAFRPAFMTPHDSAPRWVEQLIGLYRLGIMSRGWGNIFLGRVFITRTGSPFARNRSRLAAPEIAGLAAAIAVALAPAAGRLAGCQLGRAMIREAFFVGRVVLAAARCAGA